MLCLFTASPFYFQRMKNYIKILILASFLSCVHEVCAQSSCDDVTIAIHVNEAFQTIDGFGVGEADWADDVFVFSKRDEIIDALFGENGLKANILRGEVFPHYSPDSAYYDFALHADTSNVMHLLGTIDRDDLLRRGQYWLTSTIRQRYPETMFTFSVWSPPAWMKEGNQVTDLFPASHGTLKDAHFQNFADYLVRFCKAFESIGVNVYALSPSNEPGYAAPWNSCLWTPGKMGEFVEGFLLPAFRENKMDTKVLIGENPAWSTVLDKLNSISSEAFVNQLVEKHQSIDKSKIIAAGHGYTLPDSIPLPASMRETPIVPFQSALQNRIPMWVTEISDITPLDASMQDGLYWSEIFQQYLMDARVSAIIWWLGAQPTTSNESLIVMDKQTDNLIYTKRYDVFGNYSRYIPKGSRCVASSVSGLDTRVRVASFINGNRYVAVVTNPTESEVCATVSIDGAIPYNTLDCFTTTHEKRWKPSSCSLIDGQYKVSLPALSVVTLVGEASLSIQNKSSSMTSESTML